MTPQYIRDNNLYGETISELYDRNEMDAVFNSSVKKGGAFTLMSPGIKQANDDIGNMSFAPR